MSEWWYPYIASYGLYDPIMAGSIDGTDVMPHDRAIVRALSTKYKPKARNNNILLPNDPKATVFVGRLPPDATEVELARALDALSQHAGRRSPSCSRRRDRSPFATSVDQSPRVHIIRNIVTGYPCGYAFACFRSAGEAHRVVHNWLQQTRSRSFRPEGLDIPNGEKVILEPAFAETLPGWRPRRLGGGLGGRKEAGQLRFGGIARPFRRPFTLDID